MWIATGALLIAGASLGFGPSASAASPTILKCRDQFKDPNNPPAAYSVVLGKVGLPTKRAFSAAKINPRKPNSRYFAKQGLLVKPGARFELIVPTAWRTRLTIGWGNPGQQTTHLYAVGCRAVRKGTRWLAFVGGFTIDKPACVPLIVKAGTQQKTVKIGAGKACPGQTSPG